MSSLSGKRILFFAPKFFNYELAIKEEMQRQGATVHLYDERGNPSSIEKIIIRKWHFLLKSKIHKYYKNVVDLEKEFFPDYIFFLSPEAATKECIELMKSVFPKAKLILYMYDSLKNKNAKYIYKFFDKCLSFDSDDCKNYGFFFRPLFFANSFEPSNTEIEYEHDFCFIGTIHSDRARILYQLRKQFDTNGYSYFYYLYIPGKLMYVLRWIFDRYVRKFDKKYIYTTPIEKDRVAEVSEHSRCIIDINHPKQTGLTMRTIEMLGLKKKLLTTNEHIKDYDFYNPSNQIVVSRKNIIVPADNVTDRYAAVDDEIYNSYSLNAWVLQVFDI